MVAAFDNEHAPVTQMKLLALLSIDQGKPDGRFRQVYEIFHTAVTVYFPCSGQITLTTWVSLA